MTTHFSVSDKNISIYALIFVFFSLFALPEKASACSWDVWPCFKNTKMSLYSGNAKAKRKKYFRSRKSSGQKYYRRVARLKQNVEVALPRRVKRHVVRRVARKASRRSVSNKTKYLPILKRVVPRGLPVKLAAAVVTVESNWRAGVTGSVGEVGLMQLRAATAQWMGGRKVKKAKREAVRKALYKPEFNLRIGTKYLHWCYKRARRNVAATIGCYNRGPGRMWAWKDNPITRRYVTKVRRLLRKGG